MRARTRLSVGLLLLTSAPALADNRLAPADAQYLDSLMQSALFDPAGVERVRVKLPGPSVYFQTGKDLVAHDGWLVRGRAGVPDRVYFTDGFSVPAPPADRIERIDLVKQATAFFGAVQPPGTDTVEWIRKAAAEAFGEVPPFLALAAWYHRLGRDDHAAATLDVARALEEDPWKDLRRSLGMAAFRSAGTAFQAGDDATAVAAGQHFLRLYADAAPLFDDLADEVRAVVADARRRRRLGRLGNGPTQVRVEVGTTGPVDRQMTELIDGLEDVADWRFRRFPWQDEAHPIVARLTAMGEAAVPALIDVLERDDRLTRGARPQLGGCCLGSRISGLDLIAVRDLAEQVLTTVLQLNEFPPGPDETDDMKSWVRTAGRMRRYWTTYGGLPPDDRMMRLLTDPDVPTDLGLRAAQNLARRVGRGDVGWQRDADSRSDRPQPRHPVVDRFHRPTAAEAILAAADRDYAALAAQESGSDHLCYWLHREERYLDALVELGDERIGPELARRAAAAPDPALRRMYALAAFDLGSGGAWRQFARDVARGTVSLESAATARDRFTIDPRIVEWRRIVEPLVRTADPDAERALFAMTDPSHPYAKTVTAALRTPRDVPEFRHPFYLTVFRRALADLTPTGGVYKRDDSIVEAPGGDRYLLRGDTGDLLPETEERVCDEAGYRMSVRLVGAPFYHPLRKDADVQLTRLMDFYDTHRRRLRLATDEECIALRVDEKASFIPDIKPLGRPATAADVKAGLAVFHLDGKGRVWTGPIPKQVSLKADAKKKQPPVGLVVQAEADADGKAVYGVIFRNEIRKVRADEVE